MACTPVGGAHVCVASPIQAQLEGLSSVGRTISTASGELVSVTAALRDEVATLPSNSGLRKRLDEKIYSLMALLEDHLQPAASKLEDHVEDLEESSERVTRKIVKLKNKASSLVTALEGMASDALEAQQNADEKERRKKRQRQQELPATPPQLSTIDYVNLYTTSCEPELELTVERAERMKGLYHAAGRK